MDWARQGAWQEFDAFVAGATDVLFRTGYLMTSDAADAEDLVQETFLRVARHWHRVRGTASRGARRLAWMLADREPTAGEILPATAEKGKLS
ncbi:MAG: RNA polymerase sigma factor [Streptosporangiaceae bacterium]